jgi:hypothetical protein
MFYLDIWLFKFYRTVKDISKPVKDIRYQKIDRNVNQRWISYDGGDGIWWRLAMRTDTVPSDSRLYMQSRQEKGRYHCRIFSFVF